MDALPCRSSGFLCLDHKEHPKELERSLYVSLDSLWFANHTLQDVADWLHNNGGTRLFVDEVHHFKPGLTRHRL